MIFNESQIAEILKLSSKNELINSLWKEYNSFFNDPNKIYYTALVNAIQEISEKIKDKTIDIEDPYTKSILRLAETGEKVFTTLDIGKKIISSVLEESKDIVKSKRISKGSDLAI